MADLAQQLAQRMFGMTGQSPNNGNPGTVYNTSPGPGPQSYGMSADSAAGLVYRGGQNQNLGRYRPPMITSWGGYGANGPTGEPVWADTSPYSYNLPNAYGPYDAYASFGNFGQWGGPPQNLPQAPEFTPSMRRQHGAWQGFMGDADRRHGSQVPQRPPQRSQNDMVQQFLAFLQAQGG